MNIDTLKRKTYFAELPESKDIESFFWYHGKTLNGRKNAEAEIPNNGDFLVRDCSSQPGSYVLSVRHNDQALHFVINKVK